MYIHCTSYERFKMLSSNELHPVNKSTVTIQEISTIMLVAYDTTDTYLHNIGNDAADPFLLYHPQVTQPPGGPAARIQAQLPPGYNPISKPKHDGLDPQSVLFLLCMHECIPVTKSLDDVVII
ncbi:hypothetical protein TWF569_001307 [Orbilia oligospora]|nr:hypothetical protein TWF569_001307 [Orbilia oligospora]